jgi:hypothetical protein
MLGVERLQVNIKHWMAAAQGDDRGRAWRWPAGRPCPVWDATRVMNRGVEENAPARPREACHVCGTRVADLPGPICAGPHQPLQVWMVGLDGRGWQGSTAPMATELDVDPRDGHQRTTARRAGVVKKRLTSRDLARERATRSTGWQATQAIL